MPSKNSNKVNVTKWQISLLITHSRTTLETAAWVSLSAIIASLNGKMRDYLGERIIAISAL